MFAIARICAILTLLVAVAVFAYYLAYTRRINRQIRAGVVTGRALVDIPRVVLTALIVLLVLYVGVLSVSLHDAQVAAATPASRNVCATIDASRPGHYRYVAYAGSSELDDASFAEAYSREENPGYRKEVTTQGSYTFTVFTRTSPADGFHPDFLCFAEYTGTRADELLCYDQVTISTPEGNTGAGSGGGAVRDCLLYVGNLDDDSSLTINVSLLDEAAEEALTHAMQEASEADQGDFPEAADYATSTASVTVHIG